MRAIGRDCAEGHFGSERAVRARREREHAEAVASAERALFEGLPSLQDKRRRVTAERERADRFDAIKRMINAHATHVGVKAFVRLAGTGALPITEAMRTTELDRHQRERTVWIDRKVGEVRVDGLDFLKRRFELRGLVDATEAALGYLPEAVDEDSILDFLVQRSEIDSHLLEARRLLTKAEAAFEELMAVLAAAEAFLSVGNLTRLAAWTSDSRTKNPPFLFEFDARRPYEFKIGSTFRGSSSLKTVMLSGDPYRKAA